MALVRAQARGFLQVISCLHGDLCGPRLAAAGRAAVPCCDAAIARYRAHRPRPTSMPPRCGSPAFALHTPLITSAVLDALTGARVFLKAETLQRTGSFKFRVPTTSSRKSHRRLAQAAWCLFVRQSCAGRRRGGATPRLGDPSSCRPMRHAASAERTAALGAEVVLYDRASEDREAIARTLAAKRNAVAVPPYDDPQIIAGQGTAGREIVEDLAALGVTA